MLPDRVSPAKFKVKTVIYNNGDFSVAYGRWENNPNDLRLAMRWNGTGDDIGYPSQGGNPLWFQLPADSIWMSTILKAVDEINDFEDRIVDLNTELEK